MNWISFLSGLFKVRLSANQRNYLAGVEDELELEPSSEQSELSDFTCCRGLSLVGEILKTGKHVAPTLSVYNITG